MYILEQKLVHRPDDMIENSAHTKLQHYPEHIHDLITVDIHRITCDDSEFDTVNPKIVDKILDDRTRHLTLKNAGDEKRLEHQLRTLHRNINYDALKCTHKITFHCEDEEIATLIKLSK